MVGIAWRDQPRRLLHLWLRSLHLRAVVATVLLSSIAVTVIGGYVSTSVRNNLFDSRREQVVTQAGRATVSAEREFDPGTLDPSDPQALDKAQSNAQQAIQRSITTASGTTLVALLRLPGQSGGDTVNQPYSPGFSAARMVSDSMRRALQDDTGRTVYAQPVVTVDDQGRDQPGIITGSVLDIPTAGRYALYLVFDLSDVQQTLTYVQQTLVLGGIALVLLIGGVAYLVVRLVVGPVRVAAQTSERLADGDLDQRLPERGEDVLAVLARSFNRMADSLQLQIRRLAELSRVQQRFVSDVSHELRTPLTTIRLAGDVLYEKRDEFDPTTARTAELLHTQVERFETLLGDLLEMSRYDAGAVQLETEPTNLVRLVEDAIERMSALADERGSELRLVAPGGYFEADVDARRIRRILQNLLGNAIDHGEGRPIVVHVDSDERAVAIAVRDHGVGMSAAEMPRVFDRFWRADPSRQRRTGGTGLGLAISLEDAILHDASLDVWSEQGAGSCFRLTLPRRRGEALAGSPLELPPPEDPPGLLETPAVAPTPVVERAP
ncbi:MAG: HAMP domain-containing histidine kinase [Micrococcales bacterium]|nr:HAMP domain-containing histidine kinase [Micrococcales bacterium]